MKYQSPYGMSNPDAPYINGDPTIARQGSIPPAAALEYPMREITGVISKSMLNPTDADLLQMAKAIRSQRMNYSEDTGGVNALVAAYDPPIGAYTLGLILHVRIRNRVTGPTTINAGAGTVNVVRADGSILQEGDLPANAVAGLVFDGTSFQVMNFYGIGGGTVEGGDTVTNTYITKLPYVVDIGTVPGQIIAPFMPAFTELIAGDAMLVKLKNTCPGFSTIRVNALPPKAVLASDSSQCLQGDYVAGDVKLFVYDGVQFYIQPNPLLTGHVTYTIPSEWPSFAHIHNALQRKVIASYASVTIQFSSGIFPSFFLNHVSAAQITVAGTMIGPAPGAGEFVPGNPGQNIAMLRSRYGTEIQTDGVGCYNAGPGSPIIRDMLIVGVHGATTGVGLDLGWPTINASINCYNIAVFGGGQGFYGHGPCRLEQCSATSCGFVGFGSVNGGSMHTQGCHSIANGYAGYFVSSHSEMICAGASTTHNGSFGIYAGDGSYVASSYMTSIFNGAADMAAYSGSVISGGGTSAFYVATPATNTEGNMSSTVTN